MMYRKCILFDDLAVNNDGKEGEDIYASPKVVEIYDKINYDKLVKLTILGEYSLKIFSIILLISNISLYIILSPGNPKAKLFIFLLLDQEPSE